MYQGEDRVKQVNWLTELAGDIAAYSGAKTPEQAEEIVGMYLNPHDAWCLDVPGWFGDHDQRLLIHLVADRLTGQKERKHETRS